MTILGPIIEVVSSVVADVEQRPTSQDEKHGLCRPVYLATDTPLDTSAEAYWRRRPGNEYFTPRTNSIVKHRQRFEALFPLELADLVKINHYEVSDKKYMRLDPVEELRPIVGCITLCGFLLDELIGERLFHGHVPEHARIDWVTLAGPELKRWRKKFGDRTPKL